MAVLSCLPFAAMIVVECTDVGVFVLSKAVVSSGMSSSVLVVYYNTVAALLLLPYYIFRFCRNQQAPLRFSLLCRFFLLAAIGSTGQIMAFTAVHYSSPTLISAMGNLLPIFTFLLAVIFGMEKVDLKRLSTHAKILGTIVSVCGAFSATLYKGRQILITSSISTLPHQFLLSQQSHWVLGGILAALAVLMGSIWNIAQKVNVEEYPDEMVIVFFYTLFVAVQSAIYSLIAERDIKAWKLTPGIQITAVVYIAIFASLFRIGVHTWCLHSKGPLYVSAFKPLGIPVAATLALVFLGESLHLGSLIGYFVIALGFYTMMWGQVKEKSNGVGSFKYNHKTPFLQTTTSVEC